MLELNDVPRAQGTIEYLVLIAIIVVIGLVVVSLMTSAFTSPGEQISTASQQIGAMTGPVSILDAVIDPNGNGVLMLQNSTGEETSVTRINVGGKDVLPQENSTSAGGKQSFVLSGLSESLCSCEGAVGQKIICTIKIYRESSGRLTQPAYTMNFPVDCVAQAQPSGSSGAVQPQEANPPSIALLSPALGDTVESFDFVFSVSDASQISSCILLVDGAQKSSISSPQKDSNIVLYLQDLSLSAGPHTWDINCTDSQGNSGSFGSRTFTNPFTSFDTIGSCPATISAADSYIWLSGNISSSGTCITVSADNVTIDGTGANRYGIASSGSGYGINSSSSNSDARTITLNNASVTGAVAGIYSAGGSGPPSSAGYSGGNITIRNSTISLIQSIGGTGAHNEDEGAGWPGGPGGTITSFNSTITSISSAGGSGGGSFEEIPGARGASGNILLYESSADSINNYGGSGGSGGDVLLSNSDADSVNNYGSQGGDVTAAGSSIGVVSSYGTDGGPGGNVSLTDSDATAVMAYGGSGGTFSSGSPGGAVTLVRCSVPTVLNYGGYGETGGSGGSSTITDSNVTDVNSYGGSFPGPYTTDVGVAGGTVTVMGSTIANINNYGGGNPDSWGGIAGAGGAALISHSVIGTLSNYGGSSKYFHGGIGAGGNSDINYSTIGTIKSYGGDNLNSGLDPAVGAGGNGGSATIRNSTIGSFMNYGGISAWYYGIGGNSGSVSFISSTVSSIDSHGGSATQGSGHNTGGNGGSVSFSPCPSSVPSVNVAAGTGATQGTIGIITPSNCHS